MLSRGRKKGREGAMAGTSSACTREALRITLTERAEVHRNGSQISYLAAVTWCRVCSTLLTADELLEAIHLLHLTRLAPILIRFR